MLSKEFLTEISREYQLSSAQEETLVTWFESDRRSKQEIAEKLHLSDSALRTRMTNIYKKFSIAGKGPGKETQLLNFLNKKFRQFNRFSDATLSTIAPDDLVEEVRQQISDMIQEECGTMRVLDMCQPIGLSSLYTTVNILEKIPSLQRQDPNELLQDYWDRENFDRFGMGNITKERVTGLDAVTRYSKLMVLGKPGCGKTTFLKYLAIECNSGEFQGDRLPIFIILKKFAEDPEQPSLLEYICQQVAICDIDAEQITTLLKSGKVMILLDGLDEVKAADSKRVIAQVEDLVRFYKNQFVITCRIAANSYKFAKFTEVEITDFNQEQVATFVQKWFQRKDPLKAQSLIQQLSENKAIAELATTPLLLTLLCLEFQDSGKFPSSRAELYQEGVNILLKRWDEEGKIERDEIYRNLSHQQKLDLLIQLARNSFEAGEYFFKQQKLEQAIANFLQNLSEQPSNDTAIEDSQAILKSLEAQYGLLVERTKRYYSFSHLTFQEYFTALSYAKSSDPTDLDKLASHLTDTRWREVILLALELSPEPEKLLWLMKQKIDKILAYDEELQQFVRWAYQKASSVNITGFRPAAVRAFYISMEESMNGHEFFHVGSFNYLAKNLGFVDFFDYYRLPDDAEKVFLLDESVKVDKNLNALLAYVNDFGCYSEKFNPDLQHILNQLQQMVKIFDACETPVKFCNYLCHFCNDSVKFKIINSFNQVKTKMNYGNNEFQEHLEDAIGHLKTFDNNQEKFQEWWKVNREAWIERLRTISIIYRNVGHNRQFTIEQEKLINQYYEGNELLLDCLNINEDSLYFDIQNPDYVSLEVREQIIDELFLPIDEIEKRQQIKNDCSTVLI